MPILSMLYQGRYRCMQGGSAIFCWMPSRAFVGSGPCRCRSLDLPMQ